MKKLLLIPLFLSLSALAGDFKFYFQTEQSGTTGVKSLSLYPLESEGKINGTNIATLDRIAVKTDTNGYVLVTNIVSGYYRGEFQGPFKTTTNWYYFPDTNGTFTAAEYYTSNPRVGNALLLDDGTASGGGFLLDP